MLNKTITIKAQSAGLSFPESTFITLNDQELGQQKYGRGFNVAVINETTGQPICLTNFDTYVEGNSAAFAQFIENIPTGRIVAIAVEDDASVNLSEQAKIACKSLGSIQVYCLRFRTAWAMIGQKGANPRTATEELSDYSTVTCTRSFSLPSPSENGASIAVISGGGDYANLTQITLNEEIVTIAGGYQRGLNLAVFEPSNGTQIISQTFDLFTNPDQADTFAQIIADLPAGKIVAIAVQDEASINLSEAAKQACESIGSTLIHSLQFRSSWAIVGYKGATPGLAVESLSHEQSAFVRSWLPTA